MGMKTVAVDYGTGQLPIEVPESAVIVEQPKPPSVQDPEAAVRKAIADVGSTVTFCTGVLHNKLFDSAKDS